MPKSKNYTSDKAWERSSGLENSLRKREDYSRNKKWEYGALYDKNGNALVEKTSRSANRVKWAWNELMMSEGAILTHNHPNDSCFSGADINYAERWGLREIRATNKQGITYCLRRPNEADAKAGKTSDFGSRYQKEYEAYYKNTIVKGYEEEKRSKGVVAPKYDSAKGWDAYEKEWNKYEKTAQAILDKWNKRYDKWCSNWVRDHAKQYGWNYREEYR